MLCIVGGAVILYSCALSGEYAPTTDSVRSGDLIIPGEDVATGEGEQCITVCEKWGRVCDIQISSDAGGGAAVRKCRRVCESLGQYCE